MLKRLLLTATMLLGMLSYALPKEGMWIPMLLEKYNEEDMQEMGMKITAEDIYAVNQASLKDAILRFGGGCTAQFISDQGLILTNHHCGYRNIQSHSTVENDYLSDGFWAESQEEELPNEGLSATRLIRMEDVTEDVLHDIEPGITEEKRSAIINKRIDEITTKATEDTHYEASIEPFYYGNQYFMFVTEEFNDLRLVGAPPSSIGKFGGDTDNWMWPRHTGDFSLFRVYAGQDNQPAEYSEDNKPYKPQKHLSISLKGYEKEDFTFVFGYPGRTQQYLTSHAIDMIVNKENPERIDLREQRLNIMDKYMKKSDQIRIQYSAKYASVANYYKKFQGENRGIKKLNAIEVKKEQQEEFKNWANSTPGYQKRYGNLIETFEDTYEKLTPYNVAFGYLAEAGMAVELISFARNFDKLIGIQSEEKLEQVKKEIKKSAKRFFKDYHKPIDKEVLSVLYDQYYNKIDPKFHPAVFETVEKKYDGDFSKYAENIYNESFIDELEETEEFLEDFELSDKYKDKIKEDPIFLMSSSIYEVYHAKIQPKRDSINNRLDSLYRVYLEGLMKKNEDEYFYPDANSTLRVTYGKVDGYKPKNAVNYRHYTTLKGIFEKVASGAHDYNAPEKLRKLYENKDYGRYAADDGTLHTCFIASNHTSGGNSGSPLLNAKGELIGLNFDRNWEGTMSDLMYDPDQCRNISVDIRYALFIIDKFAGADHLLEEMTIKE
ncbi:MAG: S46 family peptidase [Bacteroidales bacterium]